MKDKIFVVPDNDLEAREIIKILKEAGYEEGVDLFITKQPWGASWEGLEPDIKKAIRDAAAMVEVDVRKTFGYGSHESYYEKEVISLKEYESLAKEGKVLGKPIMMQPDFSNIYGVELKGDSFCRNIDHHSYEDRDWSTGKILYKDDRTKPESSLEQVANMIGKKLTLDQKFVAENDKGFVGGMIDLGKKLLMESEEIKGRVEDIRRREHEIIVETQGITPEMEQQAENAINNAYTLENGCMIVELPHSKCTTVTDKIPMQQYNGGLFIMCGDGEIDYYGPSERVELLKKTFGGWTGDLSQRCTFYGCDNADGKIDTDKLINVLYMTDEEVTEQLNAMNQDEQNQNHATDLSNPSDR